MTLRVAFRLLGFGPAGLQSRLLSGEVGGLAFCRSFRLFCDEGSALGLRDEPLRLLRLLRGRIPCRLELFQLLGSSGGPGGAVRFERLTGAEQLIFLRLELRETGFRSSPSRLRFGAFGGLGF